MKAEALARKKWVSGELAALRVPDIRVLAAEPERAATLKAAAERWRASRVDVRDSTSVQHRTAVDRLCKVLDSATRVDEITAADVAMAVTALAAAGYARESLRKSLTVLAMILDHEGINPNPARDRTRIRLPREEPEEPEPPTAEHVEVVARILTPSYRLALLVLEATGCRVGGAGCGPHRRSRRGKTRLADPGSHLEDSPATLGGTPGRPLGRAHRSSATARRPGRIAAPFRGGNRRPAPHGDPACLQGGGHPVFQPT